MQPADFEALSHLFEVAVQSGNWALVGLLVLVAAVGWAVRGRGKRK